VSGKLVYFTALFPYVVLLILGIRGWLLEGAAEGIKYYIYPDFSKLRNMQVWADAASKLLKHKSKFQFHQIFLHFFYNIRPNIFYSEVKIYFEMKDYIRIFF
jgi:SNF family Na+-dependent transporter